MKHSQIACKSYSFLSAFEVVGILFISFFLKRLCEALSFRASLFCLFISCLSPNFTNAQINENGWEWLNGHPTGNNLRSVKIINPSTFYAVGDRGTFMRSTDGGDSWMITNRAGSPDNSLTGGLNTGDLYAMWFFDANTGIVAGAPQLQLSGVSPGVISRTTNGGVNWTYIQYDDTAGIINDIHFINSTTGFIAGNSLARLYRTTNRGQSWVNLSNNLPSIDYNAVYATSATNLFLVSSANRFLKSTNGVTWTQTTLAGTASNLKDVIFVNSNTGYVCGEPNYFAYTVNGGTNWTISNPPSTSGHQKLFLDGTTLYMAGSSKNIYRSTNNGLTWDSLDFTFPPYPNVPHLGTIYSLDKLSSKILICGSNGYFRESNNSGNTWNSLNYSVGTRYLYHGMSANYYNSLNNVRVFLGTDGGSILKSDNSGSNWQEFTTSLTGKILGIDFIDPATGFICGGNATSGTGEMAKTTDGSVVWNSMSLPSPMNTYQLNGLDFVDPNTGWVAGSKTGSASLIFKTTNSGASWISQQLQGSPMGPAINVKMLDANTGFSLADSGLYYTSNGGSNWIRNNSSFISSLGWTNMFLHPHGMIYLNGTGSSGQKKVVRSNDLGVNWVDLTGNLLSNMTVLKTCWSNLNFGLVGGTNGFTAKTTNGGVTWLQSNPGFSDISDIQFSDLNTWYAISDRNSAYQVGRKSDSALNDCDSSLIVNGGFQFSMAPWSAGFGSLYYDGNSMGCEDKGYVGLYGKKNSGQSIKQSLSISIQAGKVYELSACVKLSTSSPLNYGKLRAIAFNGSLTYPPTPSSDLAIIDISGKITCTGWSTFYFHRWKANKNFSNIAIGIENNSNFLNSQIYIDNICLREVGDTIPCYLAEFDSLGNLIIPESWGSIDSTCLPAEEDTLNELWGSVSDIYANCGAASGVDTWYGEGAMGCPDSCESIGGELPDSLLSFVKNWEDSLDFYLQQENIPNIETYVEAVVDFEDTMKTMALHQIDSLINLGVVDIKCDSLEPKGLPDVNFQADPFQGRDIVFVHGFRTGPLVDKIDELYNGGDLPRWPEDKEEFYTGYWKEGANTYWNEHIKKYFGVDAIGTPVSGGPLRNNRFLVVSHPVTQIGMVGVFAILRQISDAMNSDSGVIPCNPANPRKDEKFGKNGFVIVSHSAGALFSDAAMSLAAATRFNVVLNLSIGDISQISDRCDLHVALNGAIMGSNDAAVMLAATTLFMGGMVSDILGAKRPLNPLDLSWLLRSQLVDMSIPKYIYGGSLFQDICNLAPLPTNIACHLSSVNLHEKLPMHVVSVVGGHPSEYGIIDDEYNRPPEPRNKVFDILKKHLILLGFDDGVSTVDSQTGNSDSRFNYPNRYLPKTGLLTRAAILAANGNAALELIAALLNERIYDMGIRPKRAFGYYLDQKIDLAVGNLIWLLPIVGKSHPSSASILVTEAFLSGVTPTYYMFASSGVIPWLSPTGMVQPVKAARIEDEEGYDALKRLGYSLPYIPYKSHHSFIQGASDHFGGSTDVDNVNYEDYYDTYGDVNCEESRVIKESFLYTNRIDFNGNPLPPIVSPEMKNTQKEVVRGKNKTFTFKIFGKKISFTVWLWKRKYHLLEPGTDGNCNDKNQMDYAYRYLLRNN